MVTRTLGGSNNDVVMLIAALKECHLSLDFICSFIGEILIL